MQTPFNLQRHVPPCIEIYRAPPDAAPITYLRIAILTICLVAIDVAPAAAAYLRFAWDASPDPAVAGYVLFYGTAPGSYTQSIEVGNTTTHLVRGLTVGARYYFVVRGRAGSVLTASSNEVNGLAVNESPVISNPGPITAQPGPFSLAIAASDADGDPLTYGAAGLPAGLTIHASSGVISGSVDAGTSTITVTVSDGTAQASTTFTLTVAASNGAPTLAPPGNQSNDTDDTVALQLSASDPDGDPLTFTATGLPPGLTLNGSSGLISGRPSSTGAFSVTAAASDGALSATQTFTWAVTEVAPGGGLIAHWPLDEGFGTATDDVAGGRTATLTNGAQWTTGHAGSGVTFDGTNDYLAVAPFDVSGPGLTIAVWVKNSAMPADVDQRFVSKAAGTAEGQHYWMLGTTETGSGARLRFRLRTGTATSTLVASSGTLSPSVWYHAVATYDGTAMRLYLNGVEVGALSKTGSVATAASVPVAIGRNPDGTVYTYLHGALDDVRIYDRALSPGEVSTLSNGN